MVNAYRVDRKLPSLLLDGETGIKENDACFMKNRYQLAHFKKNRPGEYEFLLNRLIVVLWEFDCKKNI
jgi:hypothetical protein